jgi:hypothetical protein
MKMMDSTMHALINKIPDYVIAGAALATVLVKLSNIHKTMNSRLDQLLKTAVAQGRQDERDSHTEKQ